MFYEYKIQMGFNKQIEYIIKDIDMDCYEKIREVNVIFDDDLSTILK